MPRDLALRLSGRSSSHFTRVALIVAHELGVPLELDVVHDLMSRDPAPYGGHPALKLPTLQLAEGPLFGTDNICRALAEIAGRADDPRVVLGGPAASVLARSAQELVWQSMSTQVQLVVGLRVAKLPADNVFFEKATASMLGSLAWLEARAGELIAQLPEPRDVSLFEVTLFCLLEHLGFRPTVSLEPFPVLRRFATTFGSRESARLTPYRFDRPPTPDLGRPGKPRG